MRFTYGICFGKPVTVVGSSSFWTEDNLGALRGILGKAIDASDWIEEIRRAVVVKHHGTMKHGGGLWFKDVPRS